MAQCKAQKPDYSPPAYDRTGAVVHVTILVRVAIEGLAALHAAKIQSNRSREGSNTMFAYVNC